MTTLMNKIYKQMTSLSKYASNDELNNTVYKYNNTYYRTIIMKPIDVKEDIDIVYDVEKDVKDSNFKAGDHVRISKYINIFGNSKLIWRSFYY